MTTDQKNVYSSHPAFSILASTLVSPREPSQQKILNHTSTWNLETDINGFSKLSRYRNDRRKLLRCGTTIGFSYLREWGDVNLQSRDLLGDVSRKLMTLFLAGMPSLESEQQQQDKKKTQTTRVFIIHPIHSIMFAPETLFKDLINCQHLDDNRRAMPEMEALNLLDRVELLPVHDFSSAAQAISQVSDAISNIREQHRRTSVEDQEEDKDDNDEGRQPPTTLLIIEGLDAMAEDVIHNSNAMRGSAILTPVLRSLTHLSRTHTFFLSCLLVNTTALGSTMYSQQQTQPQQISATQTSPGDAGGRTTMMSTAGALHSVFARDYTQGKSLHEGQVQPLLNTLLSRTLDQGIDTHLLLQVRRGQALVEVIKDRTGDGLGKWCVWS